ncbi:tol-pal system protein YbgF [Pseudomaricurvus sp. HS19]|uniref:tol-pal system protein YbgF n=1 Tax=Pseudomaricurvus sp. HS19 TaxID=2692626 RepID=UPI00136A0886|nr:tol-pal system protein YbgF [Pseudomaricurvus sp. HS19]MYM65028.1 tol-pal system protein YbgF [Pseudomaricurvus sp. HS19]
MAAACVLVVAPACAQVEVVESTNRLLGPQAGAARSTPTSPPPAPSIGVAPADLFYQIQTLQQEVLELRGMVEEQAHEIQRLKQQRLDDYVNLDKRLSELSSGGAVAPAVRGSGGERAVPATHTTAQAPDEIQRYRTAIDLVLQKKDYDAAVTSFNQYLRDFPQGRYAANSQYWLGEIALLQEDYEQARQWFTRMLDEHPAHAKVPDATYKLGTVYHRLGDSKKARELLQKAAAGDSNAARLARSYLDNNLR